MSHSVTVAPPGWLTTATTASLTVLHAQLGASLIVCSEIGLSQGFTSGLQFSLSKIVWRSRSA
jgi:hypothetical protein